ncbi:phosphate--nucleotide phosphotransferase [Leucobacter sp. OLJS4]|uniref:PPK2 family polyphosphate kinase n=1 Tax=unclassified Leucobacter TaxID=2621730 RepID=UPI000C197A4C|nr:MULTISPECIES: PPK2 family polyphosphate kinase [unclassified Leucobacter]PIJ48039.1 phosphate--nucleotide phosphotransferase [Leucobacter sp. OLES1]PII87894.1 phosphate--nucleotide phosphotransferase [Leucobacter sp. OLCALW19]PII92878.1 phosphate--nucleotide phosphotransferase [Leucobacter sp. OLAS13]PII96339.1 phosphate--nucleotide phosphotransferase [Leucobacter sp. OLTLW20]PII96543.1 phosphate--nucleotide phosphotransferase [Leucobacter sp. OLCS4]
MTKHFWTDDVSALLRVGPGFDLRRVDPSATPGTAADKRAGAAELAASAQELRGLQEKLFAQSRLGAEDRLLVVLQAMDAAGKGGIVNHVFSQLEPYGLALTAFKGPTPEERTHDFLWRVEPRVPGPGVIGLFDRSHYEDVLIQRVRAFAPPAEIERRYSAIVDFERRIADAGVRIVKIMLHISPEEQAARLLSRLDDPEKHWKYNPGDVDERLLWPDYMAAFEIAIERTNAEHAPWYVVPANAKWYARAAVQRIVISELHRMAPEWPQPDFDVAAERARIEDSIDLRWPA